MEILNGSGTLCENLCYGVFVSFMFYLKGITMRQEWCVYKLLDRSIQKGWVVVTRERFFVCLVPRWSVVTKRNNCIIVHLYIQNPKSLVLIRAWVFFFFFKCECFFLIRDGSILWTQEFLFKEFPHGVTSQIVNNYLNKHNQYRDRVVLRKQVCPCFLIVYGIISCISTEYCRVRYQWEYLILFIQIEVCGCDLPLLADRKISR